MRTDVKFISKEQITHSNFPDGEVLANDDLKYQRQERLVKGMVLGNSYKKKIDILFETSKGMSQVKTTIWATTNRAVLLKGGISIPIHCIHDVIIN